MISTSSCGLFNGMVSTTLAKISSRGMPVRADLAFSISFYMAVRRMPGQTAFTLISYSASSLARPVVRPMTANLEAA